MIIYKVINKINNKIYIGQTINTLEHRKNQHFREVRSEKRKNTYFHNAIIKYGENNFIFEVIDETNDIVELNNKEVFWINYYNSTDKNIGYNLDSGGQNCFKSIITKRKIGETSKQKWNNPQIANKMRDGLKKGTDTIIKKYLNLRVEWECPICHKILLLPNWEAKKKKVCSLSCSGKLDDNVEQLKTLAENKHINNLNNKQIIAQDILLWCEDNYNIVINCPMNKIVTTLQPMLDIIYMKHNIQDIRSLFICFNVKNKKEFIMFLKNYLINENIC